MPNSTTLDGACCSAMSLTRYQEQHDGLRAYAVYPEIPNDPYSIPVVLAKRLLSFRSIGLDAAQQETYDRATALAREHGPCCCHCWRWTAFDGQAKELITVRHFDAARVATVWDLEDGCGGA